MNKALWSIFVCLFITACEEVPQHTIKFDKDAFDRNRAAWEAQGIHNYKIREEVLGSTMPLIDAKVTVLNDIIDSVEPIPIYNSLHEDKLLTITGIYNYVADFYDEYSQLIKNAQKPAELRIDIIYHTEYHYPKSVDCRYYVWYYEEEVAAGRGYPGESFYITNFTRLAQ